jgi:hypothetical protein
MLPLRRACSAWILRALESCCRHDVAALVNKERFDMFERAAFVTFFAPFYSFPPPGSAAPSALRCRTSAGASPSAAPLTATLANTHPPPPQPCRPVHASHFDPRRTRLLRPRA